MYEIFRRTNKLKKKGYKTKIKTAEDVFSTSISARYKKSPIICSFSPVKSPHPAILSTIAVSVLSF